MAFSGLWSAASRALSYFPKVRKKSGAPSPPSSSDLSSPAPNETDDSQSLAPPSSLTCSSSSSALPSSPPSSTLSPSSSSPSSDYKPNLPLSPSLPYLPPSYLSYVFGTCAYTIYERKFECKSIGLTFNVRTPHIVIVSSVPAKKTDQTKSEARDKGVKEGDTIISINGAIPKMWLEGTQPMCQGWKEASKTVPSKAIF